MSLCDNFEIEIDDLESTFLFEIELRLILPSYEKRMRLEDVVPLYENQSVDHSYFLTCEIEIEGKLEKVRKQGEKEGRGGRGGEGGLVIVCS